jgi:hypothetical protein
MTGVPREVIEHHFAVCPQAHPVKQKTRKQAQEKQDFIVQEIEKLKKAKLIREVAHATWIANPVVVPKANGSGRLCVDFTSLNKACPKDPYLLPRIDQIIDSTAGSDLLCFLDAFSGYHQIKMARADEEKTAFIFGLKNVGATFQRLMRKALGAQMGRNAEAYVDDIVVKTRESHTFIQDLEETFANLRKVNIKLNPAKCAFGVPSGKLLGFLVSHRGIEANLDKVKAIKEMRPLRNLKEMHGSPRALHRKEWGEGLAFLQAHEAHWEVRVDSGSRQGLRRAEEVSHKPTDHGCPNIPRALAALHCSNPENCKRYL